jgi:hypothetical protein
MKEETENNTTANTTQETKQQKDYDTKAGLPKHGTRWARAQRSHARESLTKTSVSLCCEVKC